MKKYIFIFAACLLGILIGHFSNAQNKKAKDNRPNILLIMSDDMGYSDIGCYGGEISTPNLDSLGMNGLRYTQIYNMGHCCPSRAALMTGLYPHQTGLGWMTDKNFGLPGFIGEINNQCVTIAEVLKESGYQTLLTGKWHLTHNVNKDGPQYNWPLQRGFDKFYGILTGAGNYYDPATLCRGNTLITPQNDPVYQPDNFYFTEAISDNSVSFLKSRQKEKPFFMYVAYTAAHWPMQAPEKAIKKYEGKYDEGWEVLRRKRFERAKKLGVIDSNTTLAPLDTHSWAEEKDKKEMARRMETYAAMVTIMDKGIGDIIAELKKEGIFENTIIIFLEDNGGNAEGVGYGKGPEGEIQPLGRDTSQLKAPGKNEIQYNVLPAITHSGAIALTGKKVMAGPENTYLAYLKPWANLSNTPFRKYKNFLYEGGIATPFIIHWPAGIKQGKGSLRKEVGHEIDVMPTLIQLAGANYPEEYKSHKITPVKGVSLVPTFTNQSLEPRAIYLAHQGNKAIRMGKWKAVSGGILNGPYGDWKTYNSLPWQLYNMEEDRSELKDLSAEYPEKIKEMAALWEKWARETQVYPMPWKEVKLPLQSYYMSTPWEFPDF